MEFGNLSILSVTWILRLGWHMTETTFFGQSSSSSKLEQVLFQCGWACFSEYCYQNFHHIFWHVQRQSFHQNVVRDKKLKEHPERLKIEQRLVRLQKRSLKIFCCFCFYLCSLPSVPKSLGMTFHGHQFHAQNKRPVKFSASFPNLSIAASWLFKLSPAIGSIFRISSVQLCQSNPCSVF